MPTKEKDITLDFPHTRKRPELVLYNLQYAFTEVPEGFAQAIFTSQVELAASKNILVWRTHNLAHLEHEVGGHFRPKAKKGGKEGEILINSYLSTAQQVHVLWHELAHASIQDHHDNTFYKDNRGNCEIEADTVAYNLDRIFFSNYNPLFSFSEYYITKWHEKDTGKNPRMPIIAQTFEHLYNLYIEGAGREVMKQNRNTKRKARRVEQEELARQEERVRKEIASWNEL